MKHMSTVESLLGLTAPPVAIGFFDAPPLGVNKWTGGTVPAGCAFWKEAQNGQTFYTVPSDHFECAVGAYTHAISLPVVRENELMDTVGFMVEANYIAMDEVPGIPKLDVSPHYIAYGPADTCGFTPAIVIVAAEPSSCMHLYEAIIAAGGGPLIPSLGRPGCAVVPLVSNTGAASLSFGCAGNRTFSGLPDSQMYICIPGNLWHATPEKVADVCQANALMRAHYSAKQDTLSV